MIKIEDFIKENGEEIPLIFQKIEITKSQRKKSRKETIKLIHNSSYNTNSYVVNPFFKDIVRYL